MLARAVAAVLIVAVSVLGIRSCGDGWDAPDCDTTTTTIPPRPC